MRRARVSFVSSCSAASKSGASPCFLRLSLNVSPCLPRLKAWPYNRIFYHKDPIITQTLSQGLCSPSNTFLLFEQLQQRNLSAIRGTRRQNGAPRGRVSFERGTHGQCPREPVALYIDGADWTRTRARRSGCPSLMPRSSFPQILYPHGPVLSSAFSPDVNMPLPPH